MLSEWLKNALSDKGFGQAELSRKLTSRLGRSIDRAAVNKMALGKRAIAADEMLAIAELLGVEPPAPGGTDTFSADVSAASQRLIPVKIAGKVEAGAFRSQEDLGDWDEAETFLEVRDSRFPHARHLGFAVEGDSMNALKPRPILPGDRLMALAFEDIGDRMPLRDGMVVVVERSRFDGMEREWSVKQIELYEDRIEFHPRSTNPRHRKIVVPRDGAADDGIKVEIIAVVRRVSNEFPF